VTRTRQAPNGGPATLQLMQLDQQQALWFKDGACGERITTSNHAPPATRHPELVYEVSVCPRSSCRSAGVAIRAGGLYGAGWYIGDPRDSFSECGVIRIVAATRARSVSAASSNVRPVVM
jgi:hypothetical protein